MKIDKKIIKYCDKRIKESGVKNGYYQSVKTKQLSGETDVIAKKMSV